MRKIGLFHILWFSIICLFIISGIFESIRMSNSENFTKDFENQLIYLNLDEMGLNKEKESKSRYMLRVTYTISDEANITNIVDIISSKMLRDGWKIKNDTVIPNRGREIVFFNSKYLFKIFYENDLKIQIAFMENVRRWGGEH